MGAWFRLNRDLRDLPPTGAILLLTRQGAQQGAWGWRPTASSTRLFILALNLDGFESAARVPLARRSELGTVWLFDALVRRLALWGLGGGALFSLYALSEERFAASFSTDPAVVATKPLEYAPWRLLLLLGVTSYVFDGFIGSPGPGDVLTMAAAIAVDAALLFAVCACSAITACGSPSACSWRRGRRRGRPSAEASERDLPLTERPERTPVSTGIAACSGWPGSRPPRWLMAR